MLSKKMSIYFLASVFGAFSSLADTEELILQKLLKKGDFRSQYQDALQLKQVDEELTAKKAKKKAKKKVRAS